jgi:hypothetical protein
MNPAPAKQTPSADFTFATVEELGNCVAGGSRLDWDLGAILELNVASTRPGRLRAPLFDDADLKIV